MYVNDTDQRLVTLGGVASAIGGGCWIIKGMAILISGDQPPVLFEIAPVFLIVGLLGLRSRLGNRGGRAATVGLWAVGLSALLGVITWVLAVTSDGSRSSGSEEEFQPTLLLAFVALLIGMVLLGMVTRRTSSLGDRWSDLPLALVVAVPIVGIVGGVLEAVNERLLEIPLVLYGFGWVGLGYALTRSVRDPFVEQASSG